MAKGFCGLSVLSIAIFVPMGVLASVWVMIWASSEFFENVMFSVFWVVNAIVTLFSLIFRSSYVPMASSHGCRFVC